VAAVSADGVVGAAGGLPAAPPPYLGKAYGFPAGSPGPSRLCRREMIRIVC